MFSGKMHQVSKQKEINTKVGAKSSMSPDGDCKYQTTVGQHLQILKWKDCETRILYPAVVYIRGC